MCIEALVLFSSFIKHNKTKMVDHCAEQYHLKEIITLHKSTLQDKQINILNKPCLRQIINTLADYLGSQTHTHTRNDFYTVQTVFSITLHINLPLTENFVHCKIFQKRNSV